MAKDSYRFIVAEDEALLSELIGEILEMSYPGSTARAVVSGHEANKVIGEGYDPHAIVTDFNYETPGMTGVDFIRGLIGSDKTPSLKGIILMSGNDAEQAASGLEALGNNLGKPVLFLRKPFMSGDIKKKLQEILGPVPTVNQAPK